ncbi:MAG: hypothetical protein KC483_11160 [Nitrosarchaeum sp.]|nr:hypothetical protein [Nitrosarchaeum sp.]MCA9819698.1 hypothetical protein [Nitrosarchaeum sp.]
MKCNNAIQRQILTFSLASVLMLFVVSSISVFADDTTNDFVTVTNESISNDPVLAKILENIEKSKKEFADLQQKTEQEKLVDQQRTAANNILEQELKQMFKDNEEFTPLASFNRFLKTIPDDNTKTIFAGLFDYQQTKITEARAALDKVIKNGGTLQEARDAYHDAAKIPRAEMIQLVRDLNIEVKFSDPTIQAYFDDQGKLPRYDEQSPQTVFVDLTTHATNVNSSTNSTEKELDMNNNSTESTIQQTSSSNEIIQQLLEEIRILKNRIKELENNANPSIQKAILEQQDSDSVIFASWVSDYLQGSGHNNNKVSDVKSIPVNALNAPNSYSNDKNSLALGRQGQVIVGFNEAVTGKLFVYEASSEATIRELATVQVSMDGENWITLKQTQYTNDDSKVHKYGYDLSNLGCIKHVRIIDNAPSSWGDGFDVDAVGATLKCTTS